MQAYNFTFNNVSYEVPALNEIINNRSKFDLFKRIMLDYDYYSFIANFSNNYNNLNDIDKRVYYWIYIICNEYNKIKNDKLNLCQVINKIIQSQTKYRMNDVKFNLRFIGFVLYWKYYKISFDNINTINRFNEILLNFNTPNNLTTDMPKLFEKLDNTFDSVIKDVIKAHTKYYEQLELIKTNQLKKEFYNDCIKLRDEYRDLYSKISSYVSVDNYDKLMSMFSNKYFESVICIYIIYELLSDIKYSKLSKIINIKFHNHYFKDFIKFLKSEISFYDKVTTKNNSNQNDFYKISNKYLTDSNLLCNIYYRQYKPTKEDSNVIKIVSSWK